MRICRPLVLIVGLFVIELVDCFSIEGIPGQVTQQQVVTFTWFWKPNDPTKILLAKTHIDIGIVDPSIVITTTVETQGLLSLNFINVGTNSIVGYDLDHVSYDSIVKQVKPPPSPFFNDGPQITVFEAGFSPPPPKTTGLSPPGGSPTGKPTQTGPEPPRNTPSIRTLTTASPATLTGTGADAATDAGTGIVTGPPSVSPTSNTPSGSASSNRGSPTIGRSGTGRLSMPDTSSLPNGGGRSSTASGTPPADEGRPGSPQSSNPPSGGVPPDSKRHMSIGTIIGAILGTLAFIVLLLFLFCCRRRIRQRNWPVRPGTFYGEKMIKRREEDQIERKGIADRRASNSGLLSAATSALHIAGEVDDSTSTVSGASSSRRDSEATFERPDYTIYTISEVGSSEVDATSTIEPASTEIAHEYITPRTDRQMEIEWKIFELQGQIIRLSDRSKSSEIVPSTPISIDLEMLKLREKVVRLRELQDEEWAREVTDEVPFEMLD
ncbi:hypothetical protein AAF712_010299 [Marasmius tenuissimus]|uniref:Uncharacterized protein n=1 Tax=Marasmius tenuissimus TaxID=585030 RepID=A0ABR2ZN56_9AGAR